MGKKKDGKEEKNENEKEKRKGDLWSEKRCLGMGKKEWMI